jgi:hypothetical protein
MVSCSADEINAIREVGDGSVRVIAEYDDEGYDVRYVRDDVEAKLQDVAEEIHDELVMQGMGKEYLEELFQAGNLHCSVHRFDEVTAFHFSEEEFTGLFVSIDSSSDIPLATFTDTCRDVLREE